MKSTDTGSINGLMIGSTKVCGFAPQCMAKVRCNGPMGVGIEANTTWIKNKVTGLLRGAMGGVTVGSGRLGSSMVREFLCFLMESKNKGNGLMGKESGGLINV